MPAGHCWLQRPLGKNASPTLDVRVRRQHPQQLLRRSRLAGRTLAVPIGVRGHQRIAIGPRVERIEAQRPDQLAAVHADVAGPRRDRAGVMSRRAHQAIRIVSAHAIDDLRDLVEAQPPPGAGVKDAAELVARASVRRGG